jgi:hypothetical protein
MLEWIGVVKVEEEGCVIVDGWRRLVIEIIIIVCAYLTLRRDGSR